jgi:hypothetical protein
MGVFMFDPYYTLICTLRCGTADQQMLLSWVNVAYELRSMLPGILMDLIVVHKRRLQALFAQVFIVCAFNSKMAYLANSSGKSRILVDSDARLGGRLSAWRGRSLGSGTR